ncbi:MAG: hypothetical protein ACM30G_14295, partial [Micromonosporaceae bacterium]
MRPRTAVLVAAPAALTAALAAVLLAPPSPAAAHPLGNFSVNQYLGLTLRPDRVDATAVVDAAEIPTVQNYSTVDADDDGTATDAERSGYARRTCHDLAAALPAQVDGERLEWTVWAATLTYAPGVGGLTTSRLECALRAPASLARPASLAQPASLAKPATLTVTNRYLPDRVGWREITARGDRVRLLDPPVPSTSVSGELRAYPGDLLSSALNVRSVTLRLQPGVGPAGAGDPGAAGRGAGGGRRGRGPPGPGGGGGAPPPGAAGG